MPAASGVDRLRADRMVLGLQSPERGVLTSLVRRSASPALLLSDVLVRLGKDRLRAAVSTTTAAYEADARTWLEGHRTRHIVLLGASAAPDRAIDAVHRVAGGLGIETWLVVDAAAASRGRARFLRTCDEVSYDDLLRRLGPTADARGHDADAPPRPAAAAEQARIEATPSRDAWVVGFHAAASIPPERRRDADAVATALRAAVGRMSDPACLASAARGAAVALVEFGWSLRLDTAVLSGAKPPAAPTRARGLPPDRVNAFYDPLLAAALALDALQLTVPEMLALRRAHVAGDGGHMDVGLERLDVPAALRPAIRAQLALPLARPTDPLLGEPLAVTKRWLEDSIVAAYAEHRLLITRTDLRDRPARDRRWLLERGISILRAESARRPARSLTYDPEQTARSIRSALALDWASGTVGAQSCRCQAEHLPPRPEDLAEWPVAVRRAHVAFDTGLRRSPYGRPRPAE